MRLYACICVLATALFPCATFAQQSTTPGYTAADQARFAKLRATVGTWNCTDVPANKIPDVVTTTQQGNWFVSKETGGNPNTTYTRWSHGYQQYISVTMDPLGAMFVQTTTASDPNNATWVTEWPTTMPNKMPVPNASVTLSGNRLVWSGKDLVNGKMIATKETCIKQS
jgi:hypothetical protein